MKPINLSSRIGLACLMPIMAIVLPACGSQHQRESMRSYTPKSLIANAAKENNRAVVVRGYVEASNERYRMWETKNDAINSSPESGCINIGFPQGLDLEEYDEKYAEVYGRFIDKVSKDTVILGSCYNRHLLVVEKGKPPMLLTE
jgi:hypothetical protein